MGSSPTSFLVHHGAAVVITVAAYLSRFAGADCVWACEDPGADTGEETTTNLNKKRAFYYG